MSDQTELWGVHARPDQTPTLQSVLTDIGLEVTSASAAYPPFNSAHEGFAVMDEERDEVWDHVKVKQRDRDIPAMRKELVQLAAMAVRMIRDVCDGGRGRV